MNVAVIPARGGSKRIPRKNIREFAGKPMIAHAVSAAKQSGLFERIVVSTDDRDIACIAREWGADTPFTRPAELADDFTATAPVIAHAITACRELGWDIDYACCIYPCVPFIHISDLRHALELLQTSKADYSFPVTAFPSAIQKALRRLPDGQMQPFYPEFELARTQEMEPAYHDAGQFYWGKSDAWLINDKIHRSGVGLRIPNWRVVDIDTPDDWERAVIFYELSKKVNSDEH